mgnify:CR=1 FL=1
MKKLFCFLVMIATFGLINVSSYAAETPVYDETFNNNQGAFYANGTPIVISEIDGNTTITWDGGKQTVPNTVSVFGGGNGGNYELSQITMESGTVQNLVAGGIGFTADKPSTVTNANVTINGGLISNAVTGGGYFNAEVVTSNLKINGGTALTVQGGGMASGKIDGVNYSVGTKEDSISSPNRTETANVTISGGKITYGIFGGGQGYSYTGTANLTISDGDMSNSYVTAGGSNGYTSSANVKLTGGKIGVYQTVNRGTLNTAIVKVAGASIGKFYVGGETEDKSVTGVINNINTHLISGNIENLDSGTSNGTPLTIDDENYRVTATNSIKITNDNLGSSKSAIDYDFSVPTKNIKLFVNQNMKIEAIVTTNPAGYEEVFNDLFSYSVDDESIAVVSEDGIITGVSKGTTSVTIKNGEKAQTIDVTVTDLQLLNIFLLILVICTMAIFAILFAFLYLEIF